MMMKLHKSRLRTIYSVVRAHFRAASKIIIHIPKPQMTHCFLSTQWHLPLEDKLKLIARMTYTHAKNLGVYVAIYKFFKILLTRVTGKLSGRIPRSLELLAVVMLVM